MTEAERYEQLRKAAYEKDPTFPYQTIDEYIDDVVLCLRKSSWKYSEENALKRIKDQQVYVYSDFENHVPAYDYAIDTGYSCG